jgi:type II secretion system protein G
MKGRGFTIVELLVVIVVIAILAAITIVAYNGIQGRANVAKTQSDLKSIQKLLELYKADNSVYPNTIVSGSRGWFYAWNSGSTGGDNFVQGLVPTYASSLPRPTAGTYIFTSDGTNYKLMRYSAIPSSEWGSVPAEMIDSYGSTHMDRYGYWSSGGSGF